MRPVLPYVLLIPAVAASFFWWRADQGRRAALDRVAQLEAARAQNPGGAVPAPSPGISAESSAVTSQTRVVRVPTGSDPAPYIKTIDELREQVRELSKELSVAREDTSRADARVAAESAESKKLKEQIEDLRENIQSARRLSDALQVELRAKSERLVKSEASEKLMQERAARSEGAAAKVSSGERELEDLNRRREAFMTAILRRFREVNDLYRNFTLNAPTRDTPIAGLQAGDLSRIQSAIQQSEDDLRQLQVLNARMAQIARAK
ncbi:MAG: hypothetical protein HYX27_12925 [Acidobacteria bacterium]|nr:hypothetical protein [Acidobacteriota bacterium]